MTEKRARKVHKKLKLKKLYDPILLEYNDYVKALGSRIEEVRRLYLKIIIGILIVPHTDMYLFKEYFKLWLHKVGYETQESELSTRTGHYFGDVTSRFIAIWREYAYIYIIYRAAWGMLWIKFWAPLWRLLHLKTPLDQFGGLKG